MMNAHADFMATLTRFVEEGGQSADKWWSVRRRHVAHYTAVIRCIDFVDELAGNVGPDAGRVFKSEQDEHEHMFAHVVHQRARTAVPRLLDEKVAR